MELGNMKIAVCVSGQLRGPWKECIASWKNMFPEDAEVDYFCHTWTNSTAPNAVAHANKDSQEREIKNNEFNELKKILKPKKLKIDEPITFSTDQDWAVYDPNYHSQFYGVMMAGHLKREYELQTTQEYDVCIRMRYDNFSESKYHVSQMKQGEIHVIHQTFDKHHRYRCSDVYFASTSFDYDRISDFFSCIPKYQRTWFEAGNKEAYGPEHVLAFHIKANNIKPVQTYMPIKLKREEEMYTGGSHELA